MHQNIHNIEDSSTYINIQIDDTDLQFLPTNIDHDFNNSDVHLHNCYEIIMVYSGKLNIKCNNSLFFNLKAYDLFILPPETKYSIITTKETIAQKLTINIKNNKNDTQLNFYFKYKTILNKISCTPVHNQVELTKLLYNTIYIYNNHNMFARQYRLYINLMQFTLKMYDKMCIVLNLNLSQITNLEEIPKTNIYDLRSILIDSYIKDNLSDNISLQDLSNRLNLSPRQLNRIIKSTYGKTFYSYVTFLRIQTAKQLLSDNNISIEQVAYKVGYSTQVGFYNVFRKMTGITPSKYRTLEDHNDRL